MLSDSADVTTSGASSRHADVAAAIPWIQGRDVFVAFLVASLWLIALLLPEKRWLRCARCLARQRLARSARLTQDERETVEVVIGRGEDKADWIEGRFRQEWLSHKYLSWIQVLACYRPWPYRPKPTLIGQAHLDEALARGRGVVLLTANFIYKDLMTKAALADAGVWVCHLTRDSHGFAESRIGRRLLNPIYAGIERRYVRERLVFSGNRTKDVNRLIRERLRQNCPIQVTVTPIGRRVAAFPFLHGRIRIATGALNFACEAGATVLPVFTIRRADGRVETMIEHPLDMPAGAARGETIEAMLEDYVPRLETYVAQYPEQFGFPLSDRHGQMLIEPWTPSPLPGRTSAKDRVRQAVPELT